MDESDGSKSGFHVGTPIFDIRSDRFALILRSLKGYIQGFRQCPREDQISANSHIHPGGFVSARVHGRLNESGALLSS